MNQYKPVTNNYYEIHSDACYAVSATKRQIDLSEETLRALADNTGLTIKRVINAKAIDDICVGDMNMVVYNNRIVATTQLIELPLFCRIIAIEGLGTIVPDFREEDKKANPVTLLWTPPASCRLVFAVTLNTVQSGYSSSDQYLLAVDEGGKFYKMPASNLYDDGRICSGNTSSATTIIGAMMDAIAKLKTSRWQHDLSGGIDSAKVAGMFSFKPKADEGFEQLPVTNWQKCCFKISSEFLNNNVII